MPAILTSPQLEPHPAREGGDIGDNGTGGKPPAQPPIDKFTGGGGSGDDKWDDQPVGQRGPRERLTQYRIGLACVLAFVSMLFIGLVSTFLVNKANVHIDVHNNAVSDWRPLRIPRILWLNTALLALSSLTAEFARRTMFNEHQAMDEWFGLGKPTSRRAALWLSLTLTLGLAFVTGQVLAWQQIGARHVFYSSHMSLNFFYLFTITHALHLLLGLGGLILALAVLRSSKRFANRQILVDTAAWYWHAMGLLWLGLFLLLEYGQ